MKTSQNFRESGEQQQIKSWKTQEFQERGREKKMEKPSRLAFLNSRVITRLIAGPKRARRKKEKPTWNADMEIFIPATQRVVGYL